jgi:HEPN domain-containing protein
VTEADVIAHWRKGARDALEMAQLAFQAGKYDHALFNSHLAVEKALKSRYMQRHDSDAPYTHNLLELAEELDCPWTDEQKHTLDELTDFVVQARYSDPAWADAYADADHVSQWISRAAEILSLLGT